MNIEPLNIPDRTAQIVGNRMVVRKINEIIDHLNKKQPVKPDPNVQSMLWAIASRYKSLIKSGRTAVIIPEDVWNFLEEKVA